MHPIILVTFLLNLIVLKYVYGIFGLLFTMLVSGGLYYFISTRGGPKMGYWGRIVALAFGHVAGFVAIANAPWGSFWITASALMLEVLFIGIFSVMRK